MIHPLNALDKKWTEISTTHGTRRISERRYILSTKHRGVFSKHVGKILRLISLDEDTEPGNYMACMVSAALEEELFNSKPYPMDHCMGLSFSEIDPLPLT